jgi:hypothetical protein
MNEVLAKAGQKKAETDFSNEKQFEQLELIFFKSDAMNVRVTKDIQVLDLILQSVELNAF